MQTVVTFKVGWGNLDFCKLGGSNPGVLLKARIISDFV